MSETGKWASIPSVQTDFLSSIGKIFGSLAGIILVVLALIAFDAMASKPRASAKLINDDFDSRLKAAALPDPQRFGRASLPSRARYPIFISFSDVSQHKAVADQGIFGNLVTGGESPSDLVFDSSDEGVTSETVRSEENQNQQLGAEPEMAAHTVGREPTRTKRNGRLLDDVIAVKFDLASQIAKSEHLSLRKPLTFNGAASGEVTLRVVQDSRITARLADLQRVIGGQLLASIRQAASEEGFVDFNTLRDAGFAVRYDAARDVLHITTTPRTN